MKKIVWVIKNLFIKSSNQFSKHSEIKTFSIKENSSLQTMIETTDNGYILGAWSHAKKMKNKNYWIIKINSRGMIEWENFIKRKKGDTLNFISQTTDNGFILRGLTTKNTENDYKWLVKLNKKGQIIWKNQSLDIEIPEIYPPVHAF